MGPNDPIVLPSRWPDQVDYESELAVVIGRSARDVGEGEVWDHVAGVTMANDVSARDIQLEAFGGHEMTLTHAKGLDGFKPMGPCLVTLDELDVTGAGGNRGSACLDVHIGCAVNGEQRQDARTADLVHDVPRCVSYVSQYMRLDPGDVLLTGSPAGVGFFQGKFLRAGDVVETSGEGIGTMRNEVVVS
jgi:2-keto-4-pentenoate hydratase/2-oxohepta-3-ene-1,7-dioic acid hydratase in catechol pathway